MDEARKDVVPGAIALLILKTLSTALLNDRNLTKRIAVASAAVANALNMEKPA